MEMWIEEFQIGMIQVHEDLTDLLPMIELYYHQEDKQEDLYQSVTGIQE
jgi:hypothetical protein